MVDANLTGHDSHGVIRVPQHVGQVGEGTIVPKQKADVVRETEVVTVLDGHPQGRRALAHGRSARRRPAAVRPKALASSIGRLPFTAAEGAWTALALHRAGPVPPPIFIIGHMRPRIEACLHSIHDYSKSTYAFSEASVARVTECWRPFVTRFGYNPPDLERRVA